MTEHARLVLLNRLVSRSVSRAPREIVAPTIAAREIFERLKARADAGESVERFNVPLEGDDADDQHDIGSEHNWIRLAKVEFFERNGVTYAVALVDYVDNAAAVFPVVDIKKMSGRDITGEADERGATAAHVVVRLPNRGDFDDGSYRVAIEFAHSITRKSIAFLISRQLRRIAGAEEWKFPVPKTVGRKVVDTYYRFHAKIELLQEVGRSLSGVVKLRPISHLVFTKRSEKQSIGNSKDVRHDEFLADVSLRISGKEAPDDPSERSSWFMRLKDYYSTRGYTVSVHYKSLGGGVARGSVHEVEQGAADVLMCDREQIKVTDPRKWRAEISPEFRDKMIELLERDELWERAK